MKAKIKFSILFSVVFALVVSCGGGPTGSSDNTKFEGVPSGEIVPVEKRDSVLTGIAPTDSQNKAKEMTQKWWLHIISKVDYSGCDGYEDEEITQENTYYGFKPDGKLYYKVGVSGSEHYITAWEWADEGKDAISLENYPDIEFELTSLNDEEIVYASLQSEGSCEATTWEQFGEPFTEDEEVEVPVTQDMQWSIEMNETLYDYLNADFATNFTIENQPANGTLTLLDTQSGEFEYSPSQGFVGQDSFTFSAYNQAGSSDISTVTINVGGGSTAENKFSYNGETHQLSWGMVQDFGEYTEGFRNYDFMLAEKEENPAHVILFWMESYGAESFDSGTYVFGTDTNVQHNLLYDGELQFYDADGNSYFEVTGGQVEVFISGDIYTLIFDLILDNGENLTGSFEYPFTVVSEKVNTSYKMTTASRFIK